MTMSRSETKLRRLAQALSRAAVEPTPSLPSAEGAEGGHTTTLDALAPHLSVPAGEWAQYAADESVLHPGPLFPDFDASLSIIPEPDQASSRDSQEAGTLDDPIRAVVRAADEAVQAFHFRLVELSVSRAAEAEQSARVLAAAEAKASHAEAERALLQAERDEARSSVSAAREEIVALTRALESAKSEQSRHEKSKSIADTLLASHERLREVMEAQGRQEKASLLRQMAAQAEEQELRLRALAEKALKQHSKWVSLPQEERKRALLPAPSLAARPRKSEPIPGASTHAAPPTEEKLCASDEDAARLSQLEDKLVRRTERLGQAQLALRRAEREGDQARFAAEVAQQDASQLRTRLGEAEADLASVREKLAAAQTELKEAKAHYEAQQVADGQGATEKDKLSARVSELEQEVKDVRVALDLAETARASLQDGEQQAIQRARKMYQETKVLREELASAMEKSKTLAQSQSKLEEQLRNEGARLQALEKEKEAILHSREAEGQVLVQVQAQLEESRRAYGELQSGYQAATGEVERLSRTLDSAREEQARLTSLLSGKEKEQASLTAALAAAEERAKEESTFATRAAEEQMLLQQKLARTERSLSKATAALEAHAAQAEENDASPRPTAEALQAAEAERDALLSQLAHLTSHLAAVETRWAHALALAHTTGAELRAQEASEIELREALLSVKRENTALLSDKAEVEVRLQEAAGTIAELDGKRVALIQAQEAQEKIQQDLESALREKNLLLSRVEEVEAQLSTLDRTRVEAESCRDEALNELTTLRQQAEAVKAERTQAQIDRSNAVEELKSLKEKAQIAEKRRAEAVKAFEEAQAEMQRPKVSGSEESKLQAEVEQLRASKEDLETQVADLSSLLEQQASEIEGYDDRVLELKKAQKKVQAKLAKVQAERDGLKQRLAAVPSSSQDNAASSSQVRSPAKSSSPSKVRVVAGTKRPSPWEQPGVRPAPGANGLTGLNTAASLGVKSFNQPRLSPSVEPAEKAEKPAAPVDGAAEKRTNVSLLRQQLLRANRAN